MNTTLESMGGALQIGAHLALGPVLHRWRTRWGATDEEVRLRLPGDDLVPEPDWSYTHAVTIDAPRSAVWPWLVQVGQGRGGFYSYEALENLAGCDIHNVLEIRPELQRLRVGDTVRMHASGFGPRVTLLEPERTLVLGGPPGPDGSRITWGFHLRDGPNGTTRCLERGRHQAGTGALAKLTAGPYLLDPISFVMSRKMLRTIKRLAEGSAGTQFARERLRQPGNPVRLTEQHPGKAATVPEGDTQINRDTLGKAMSTPTISAIGLPAIAPTGTPGDQFRVLLHYAVLAPSSHNSQPWLFEITGDRLRVHADPGRWLRVADADRRELYLSVGCALENLLVAAEHFGLAPRVSYFPEGEDGEVVAEVRLAPDVHAPHTRRAHLFDAIAHRHTNHREYDGRPLGEGDVAALERVAGEDGIGIHLTTDAEVRRQAEELVVRADALQFADPAWRQELAGWLAQGVFGTGWLMSKMSALAVGYLNLGASTASKDTGLLRSASALGVVTAQRTDRRSQVLAGQAFERLFLTATARGIQLQPMNQVLQVPEVREEFTALLPPEWGVPQITFRLGYAEAERPTPRRPLEEVLREHGNETPIRRTLARGPSPAR